MRRLGLLGYAASGMLVLLMAWALYGTTGAATQTAGRVDFILEILSQLDGVKNSMARAESAQRGYLLYNEQRFRLERDREIGMARAHAERIGALVVDPRQQGRVRELAALIDERFARMKANVIERRAQPDSGVGQVGKGVGMQLRGRIDEITSEMAADAREATLREARRILRGGGRLLVIASGPRAGLTALLSRAPATTAFDPAPALRAGGFSAVRTLAEREGLIFVEGIKRREPSAAKSG